MRTIKLAIVVLTASCLAGSAQAQFFRADPLLSAPSPYSPPPVFQPPAPPPPPPHFDYQGYGQWTVRPSDSMGRADPMGQTRTFCTSGLPC